jgi:HSP20 family protein
MNTICVKRPATRATIESQLWQPLIKRRFADAFGGALDELLSPLFVEPEAKTNLKFDPKFSIHDKADEIVIKAEVPGVASEDLDISLSEDSLIIQGEKKPDWEQVEGESHYNGRSYGKFSRHFPIKTAIEIDSASLHIKDGILTIRLPKAASTKERIRKLKVSGH